MPIAFHPRAGQILLCDFSTGFKEPEMVKSKRPVIVLANSMRGRVNLVTVVALSTTTPDPVMRYHLELPRSCLPQLGRFQDATTWVKGDMLYTVGFHRLDPIRLGKRHPTTGKRLYFQNALSRETMRDVYACVLHGLNLGHLAPGL